MYHPLYARLVLLHPLVFLQLPGVIIYHSITVPIRQGGRIRRLPGRHGTLLWISPSAHDAGIAVPESIAPEPIAPEPIAPVPDA